MFRYLPNMPKHETHPELRQQLVGGHGAQQISGHLRQFRQQPVAAGRAHQRENDVRRQLAAHKSLLIGNGGAGRRGCCDMISFRPISSQRYH